MIHLTSWPTIIVEYGLAVFCLLDVVLMNEPQVRWAPRFVWALFLLFFPVAGSIGWITAGRPWRHYKVIPDDLEPDEPTVSGDPFHDGTGPAADLPDPPRPDSDESSGEGGDDPSAEARRSRGRPPRQQPERSPDEPAAEAGSRQPGATTPDGGNNVSGTEEKREAERQRRERHERWGRERWRWRGRPHRRPGAGPPGSPSGDDLPAGGDGPASPDTPPGDHPLDGPVSGSGPSRTGGPRSGRPGPGSGPGTGAQRTGSPVPADLEDPSAALISELFAVHEEHEQTLRRWEADLRHREQALRAWEAGLRHREEKLQGRSEKPPGDDVSRGSERPPDPDSSASS